MSKYVCHTVRVVNVYGGLFRNTSVAHMQDFTPSVSSVTAHRPFAAAFGFLTSPTGDLHARIYCSQDFTKGSDQHRNWHVARWDARFFWERKIIFYDRPHELRITNAMSYSRSYETLETRIQRVFYISYNDDRTGRKYECYKKKNMNVTREMSI